MQIFNLDISVKKEQPWLLAKQGDVGRRFQAIITDAGVAYPVGADTVLSVWYSGTSGEGNFSVVGDHSAFVVQDNAVTVELITQMLSSKGGGSLCLVLNAADGKQIGMWDIPYQVEGIPGGDSAEARQYYTVFSEATHALLSYVDRVEQTAQTFSTDATLLISGKAADAKAAGDALAKRAPSGFGLGEQNGRQCTDCNEAVRNGWYRLSGSGCLNVPTRITSSAYGTLFVETRTGSATDIAVLQRFSYGCYYARRQGNAATGVWGEWEYENPPMKPGEEYRTTERSNGKAVYTKRINFGSMPNATNRSVSTGLQPEQIVSFRGIMRAGTGYVSEFPVVNASMAIIARAIISSSGTISVTTAENLSTSTAEFIIRYTKD